MATTMSYKVVDLSSQDEPWSESLEGILNRQAQDGWELVTAFQRAHEATQVGSTTVHVPSLLKHGADIQTRVIRGSGNSLSVRLEGV
jgi:hypothetical protein